MGTRNALNPSTRGLDMREALARSNIKENIMKNFLSSQVDSANLQQQLLRQRHARLLDRRQCQGFRRSLICTTSLYVTIGAPDDPNELVDVNKVIFFADSLVVTDNNDLVGRLTPKGKFLEEGTYLLNNPDMFKLVKINPVFGSSGDWTSIKSLYLSLR